MLKLNQISTILNNLSYPYGIFDALRLCEASQQVFDYVCHAFSRPEMATPLALWRRGLVNEGELARSFSSMERVLTRHVHKVNGSPVDHH
jgi:hypothetical protein